MIILIYIDIEFGEVQHSLTINTLSKFGIEKNFPILLKNYTKKSIVNVGVNARPAPRWAMLA